MAESSTENYKPVVESVKLEDETEIPVFVKDDQITNNEAVLQQQTKKLVEKVKRSLVLSASSDSDIPQTAERSPASRALTSAGIRQRTVDSDSAGASSAGNDAFSALKRSKKLKPTPENLVTEGDSDIPQAAERSPASRALTSAAIRQRTVGSDSAGASSAGNDALTALKRSKKLKPTPANLVTEGDSDIPQTAEKSFASRALTSAAIRQRTVDSDSAGASAGNDALTTLKKSEKLKPTPANFVTEERSAQLIKASRYQKAILLLEDCLPTQRQQALLFLCYFKQENIKAKHCIDVLRELMTSSSPPPKPEDVFELVTLGISDPHEFIGALIFLSCFCKLYSFCPDPQEALRGIKFCSAKIAPRLMSALNKITTPKFAVEVGVKIFKTMIADLISLDLEEDEDEDERVLIEAGCYHSCGYLLFKADQHENTVDILKTGIDLMRKRFGKRAEEHKVYGQLLHDLGSTFVRVRNYMEAETWHENAKETALDLKNDKLKQKKVKTTKNKTCKMQSKNRDNT